MSQQEGDDQYLQPAPDSIHGETQAEREIVGGRKKERDRGREKEKERERERERKTERVGETEREREQEREGVKKTIPPQIA